MVLEHGVLTEPTALRGQTVVAISPHPDDAVWSCGGYLAALVRNGTRALVLTVFDGDSLRSDRGIGRERRAEDLRATARIGVDRVSLGFPDAAYRGYTSPLARLRTPQPKDDALTQTIAAAMVEILSAADQVLMPVADGTHVDHVLTRRAVTRCAAVPVSWELTGYAEFPYRLPTAPAGRPIMVPFQPWLEASLEYTSQISVMFGSASSFEAKLRERYLASEEKAEWVPYAFTSRTSHPRQMTS